MRKTFFALNHVSDIEFESNGKGGRVILSMKIALLVLLIALSGMPSTVLGDPEPLKVLRYGPVNDTVVDAISPGGLVKTMSGDLIVTFSDKGDSAPGSKSYFVRSKDQGKTWARPFLIIEEKDKNVGLHTSLVQLPDGELMMIVNRITHRDSSRKGVFGHRESKIELKISKDNGETFEPAGFLDGAPGCLTATSSTVYQLNNGDLILPAYCYPKKDDAKEGYQYGAGFFRRSATGKKWARLEQVFQDPPSVDEAKQNLNEAAFAVRDDGTVIAYARVDVHHGADFKENRMWRCQSDDHGKTWSQPVETEIAGVWPMISRLDSGEFVLMCGLRDSKVRRRTTSIFTSKDAIHWRYRGHPYYSRNNGIPANSATGGSQSMISMGGNSLYVVFYAHDPLLPGYHKTYVDGCLLDLP